MHESELGKTPEEGKDSTLYRRIMEHLPIAVYDAFAPGDGGDGHDGGDIYLNPQLRHLLAVKDDDPRSFNRLLFDIMHPDDRADAEGKIAQARRNHSVYFIECRIMRPGDPDYVWVLLEGRFIYDDGQRAVRHAGIIIDVNEHFQRERQLRESAERYRKITETMSDYVYTVRVKNGVAVETIHGGACQPVTGYTPADFAKNPNLWIEMVHEQDRQMVAARAQRMLRGEAVEQLEHRIIHRNGRTRWVNSTIVPHRDENGEIVFFDGVIRDITKQKQEAEIAKQRHYVNEILLNSVPYASILLDQDGEVIAVNSQGGLIGFRPDANWESAWRELSGEGSGDLLAQVIEKGERQQREISNHGQYYEVTFVPMEPDLCLACFYDISKRKNFEKAMHNSRMLTNSIISSTHGFVIIINADLTVADINPLTEKLIGVSAADIKGKKVEEAFVPEQAANCAARVREVMAAKAGISYHDVFLSRYLYTDALPVFADDQKTVGQVLFVAHDHSEQKRTELNLLEAYQTLMTLVECAPAAIVTYDPRGRVKTWNPAAVELFGWQPEQVCGKHSFWLDNSPAIKECRHAMVEGGRIHRKAVSVQCADGAARQGFLTGTALHDGNGDINGYMVIIERA